MAQLKQQQIKKKDGARVEKRKKDALNNDVVDDVIDTTTTASKRFKEDSNTHDIETSNSESHNIPLNTRNNDEKPEYNTSKASKAIPSSSSRYFVPYRTIGVICSGTTFDLMTHQNSAQSIVAVPIQDRFQLVQTDRLHPVLISQTVTTPINITDKDVHPSLTRKSPERSIQHIISDPTLSITIVSHGFSLQSFSINSNSTTATAKPTTDTITLYHRTRPIQSLQLASFGTSSSSFHSSNQQQYTIVDLLSLGRIQQDIPASSTTTATDSKINTNKKRTKQNVTIFAVVLAAVSNQQVGRSTSTIDPIPTVGYDSNDDDADDDQRMDPIDPKSKRSHTTTSTNTCMGQVIICTATRTDMKIQRRITFDTAANGSNQPLHDFVPYCAIHPATYLNKIVIGGSIQDQMAAILINIRTGKVIHVFQCFKKENNMNKAHNFDNSKATIITTMEQSPAVDTVAMGTNRGMVYLVNLKHDQILFQLRHKSKASTLASNTNVKRSNELQAYMTTDKKNQAISNDVTITSISFRTDGAAIRYGMSPMAVGRSDGNITIWDLTPPQTDDNDDPTNEPMHHHHSTLGRTILCEMNQVHVGGVAKIQYFPQEPLLLSTGTTSNSIIMHIFDNPDHSGRILRQRKGHRLPPSYIRYLHPGSGAGNGILANMSDGTDASSCQILSSGGQDRTIRVFSTVRSVLDKEFSQGRGIEKRARQIGLDSTAELLLPPLIGMSMCEARTREWGDLVTIHENHSFAYVWSTKRGAQCGPVLRQLHWNVSAMKKPPPLETHASSVTISSCGNFALIGTKGGVIYRYNVQSGIARGSFPRSATTEEDDRFNKKKEKTIGDVNRTMKALEKTLKTNSRSSNLDKTLIDIEETAKQERMLANKLRYASHIGFAVTGLAVDILNKTLLSVGMDAKLIIWNFGTQTPHQKCPITLPHPATKLCHVRESDLAAIALKDYSILLFDCSSLYVIRRFGISSPNNTVHHKHTAAITDLCFSGDGRSLYSSSMDSTIRVWDVPTNKCVDWLAFKAAPTSLTISPTGQHLATTHVGKVGIHLWSDKSFYETVHTDGVEITRPSYMDESIQIDDSGSDPPSDEFFIIQSDDKGSATVKSKEKGLITLSGLPVAHWKNLFHLELVRQRNKPIEPPKKPPSAPFFLQWRGEQTLSAENLALKDAEFEVDDEWAAAWSDDEANENQLDAEPNDSKGGDDVFNAKEVKRTRITHFRSHIATLLKECSLADASLDKLKFHSVTDYIATLGPSAIDVELSSLCNGMHDLEEGIPLLLLTIEWLLEACQSRERFEAINSYLHRFLFLHAITIAGIESDFSRQKKGETKINPYDEADAGEKDNDYVRLLESIANLKRVQHSATDDLRVKMDHTLCLLRHFSRMI